MHSHFAHQLCHNNMYRVSVVLIAITSYSNVYHRPRVHNISRYHQLFFISHITTSRIHDMNN